MYFLQNNKIHCHYTALAADIPPPPCAFYPCQHGFGGSLATIPEVPSPVDVGGLDTNWPKAIPLSSMTESCERAFWASLGMKVHKPAAHYPHSNGCKRFKSTLKSALQVCITSASWTDNLLWVCWACAFFWSLTFSPTELVSRHVPLLPGELLHPNPLHFLWWCRECFSVIVLTMAASLSLPWYYVISRHQEFWDTDISGPHSPVSVDKHIPAFVDNNSCLLMHSGCISRPGVHLNGGGGVIVVDSHCCLHAVYRSCTPICLDSMPFLSLLFLDLSISYLVEWITHLWSWLLFLA